MTWTTIPDSDVDQDSPVTVALMTALRDNVSAIANGDVGAPRIQDLAHQPFSIGDDKLSVVATITGAAWVGNRYHLLGFNGIAAICMAKQNTGGSFGPSTVFSGANLDPASCAGSSSGGSLSGSWRLHGFVGAVGAADTTSIFQRVA